jgi:hypothetical protein
MVSNENASQVVAGPQVSAILKNGTLRMVGRNDFGQVGDMANMTYYLYQDVNMTGSSSI